jgi:serine/threonine-protein kinase
VPDVTGQPQAAATSNLQSDGFVVSPESKTSTTVQKGDVIATDPAHGKKADQGSTVKLEVSAGPVVTNVELPNLVGQQLTAAIAALNKAGLNFKTTLVPSTHPADTVIKQDPAGNQTVKSTTLVTLTVSESQTSTSVPNVVGLSQVQAGSSLNAQNLTVGNVTMACSQQYPTGQVASQTPAANTQQPTSTPVNLVVSNGPCSATVPNVVGDTQADATSAINGTSGLTLGSVNPVLCFDSAPGTVQSQNPSAGTVLDPPFPQSVNISVCGSQSTTTTTEPGTTTTTTAQGIL